VARQAGFIEYDHVIQALAAKRADHPLDIGSLLRRSGRSQHFLNAQLLHLLGELRTEDAAAVSQ
jgi:hypothetical protein